MTTSDHSLPGKWQPPASASPQAQSLHRNFMNAVTSLHRDLVRSIFYLRIISERKVFHVFGFSSIYDYASRAAGLSREQCQAFLRLGAELKDSPEMQQALSEGTITWRKADLILGNADEQDRQNLIEAAKNLGEAELKVLIKTPRVPSGGTPAANSQPPPQPVPPKAPVRPRPEGPPRMRKMDGDQYVSFKLSPEQYTRWAGLLNRLRINKEDALVQGMEALAAGHTSAASSGGYLIVLHECPTCSQASLRNSRGEFQAPPALLEAARCDGIIEDEQTARRRRAVPPRLRRQVLKRDGYQCAAEGCSHTNHLEMHHRTPAAQGGRSTLENLVTLCRGCHRRLHEEEEALRAANSDPDI